jgi:hypothetical protein
VRTAVIALAAVVVIAVALLGALEAPALTVSCTTQGTALVGQTTSVASTVATTTATQTEQTTTQTERVYDFNPRFVYQPTLTSLPNFYLNNPSIIITSDQYVYQDFPLIAGMNVNVYWTANNTLDVYVFNSSENAAYATSNATMTSPNITSSPNSRAGSLSFHVSVNDSYYVAFYNPHNGTQGPGSYEVTLLNATGIATFPVTTASLVTETTSTVVLVPQLVTSTQTTTGSYRRTGVNLLSQVGGTACSG